MSKTSISKNNLAKDEIMKAINNYNDAITTIKNGNNNVQVNEIISLINQNINDLSSTQNEIDKINTQINNKLKELEKDGSE